MESSTYLSNRGDPIAQKTQHFSGGPKKSGSSHRHHRGACPRQPFPLHLAADDVSDLECQQGSGVAYGAGLNAWDLEFKVLIAEESSGLKAKDNGSEGQAFG